MRAERNEQYTRATRVHERASKHGALRALCHAIPEWGRTYKSEARYPAFTYPFDLHVFDMTRAGHVPPQLKIGQNRSLTRHTFRNSRFVAMARVTCACDAGIRLKPVSPPTSSPEKSSTTNKKNNCARPSFSGGTVAVQVYGMGLLAYLHEAEERIRDTQRRVQQSSLTPARTDRNRTAHTCLVRS